MKNYLNYIKENVEQGDLIRKCIETETFKPLIFLNKDEVSKYLNANWYKYKPNLIKKLISFLKSKEINIFSDNILKAYDHFDYVFENLVVAKSEEYPDSIFYKLEGKTCLEYWKGLHNWCWYDSNIFLPRKIINNLNYDKRNELMINLLKEYLNINVDMRNIRLSNSSTSEYWYKF